MEQSEEKLKLPVSIQITASLLLVGMSISKSSVSVRPYSEQLIRDANLVIATLLNTSSTAPKTSSHTPENSNKLRHSVESKSSLSAEMPVLSQVEVL